MAKVGEFKFAGQDFEGAVQTMDHRFNVTLKRNDTAQDQSGPHFQAYAGNGAEIGVAS